VFSSSPTSVNDKKAISPKKVAGKIVEKEFANCLKCGVHVTKVSFIPLLMDFSDEFSLSAYSKESRPSRMNALYSRVMSQPQRSSIHYWIARPIFLERNSIINQQAYQGMGARALHHAAHTAQRAQIITRV
jgi:hypothetical protein